MLQTKENILCYIFNADVLQMRGLKCSLVRFCERNRFVATTADATVERVTWTKGKWMKLI